LYFHPSNPLATKLAPRGGPNRFHGLAGAAAAAERAGDAAKAKLYREKLVQLATADSDRPELLAAKRSLTEN
jgi:hypothetical protein